MTVIGGFLFGYDTGVVSSAMLFIPEALNLDYVMTELVVSITLGGCAIFSLVAGFSNDFFGRRLTILVASGIFTVGAAILGAAQNAVMLLIGRFIIGAAIGLSSMTVPTYLGETCPVQIRGLMVTTFQLMVTLGFFLASVFGAAFSYIDPLHVGWRLMVAVAGIPSAIQLIGFLFLPESPRYLATNKKEDQAKKVLMKIYDNNHEWTDFELSEIRTSHQALLREQEKEGDGKFVLFKMLSKPPVRRALMVGCSLQGFQMLSGVNTIMFYTASIIKMSGIKDPTKAIWMSCAVTGVNFVCTFIPIALVERLGRKKLLLASMIGVMASLIVLGAGFITINKTSPTVIGPFNVTQTVRNSMSADNLKYLDKCAEFTNCDNCVTQERCGFCFLNVNEHNRTKYGYCLPTAQGVSDVSLVGVCSNKTATDLKTGFASWEWNFCPTKKSWLPMLGMVCYLCAFSTGLAPMPWVINAEIYPQWARSTGISCATATNWIFNLIISQTFLTLTERVSKYGAFFIYLSFTAVAWVWFFFVVPETKGVRIEDVETLFGGKPATMVSTISDFKQTKYDNEEIANTKM